MTFTMLSPTEGSASVARCDPDVGSESESGMSVMTGAVAFWKGGSFQLLISHTPTHQFGHLPSVLHRPFRFSFGLDQDAPSSYQTGCRPRQQFPTRPKLGNLGEKSGRKQCTHRRNTDKRTQAHRHTYEQNALAIVGAL